MNRKLLLINPQNRVSLYGEYLWEPLAFAYVAATTPEHWEVEVIDEQIEGQLDYTAVHADLVGLTAFTTQATRAYQIARQFRDRGIPVVMGGIHASLVQTEALAHVDVIYQGECEGQFGTLIADFEAGQLGRNAVPGSGGRVYQGQTLVPSAQSIWPNRSIYAKYSYSYASAQTSRGCPMDCSFCSVTAFNGNVYRTRSASDVVAEIAAIASRDLIFVDDDLNGFSKNSRERCLNLFREMKAARLNKQWIAQVTVNFGDDDELPRLAREAGCAGVFIGLESLDSASLRLISKGGKSQARGVAYYHENIARIHAHGIGVVGSFILGIDSQDMSAVVPEILGFAEQAELDGLNPTILTPLPGTRDFARLEKEGRILFQNYPDDWERYTLAFPVTTMPNTTGAGLMRRYFELLQWFRPEHIAQTYWRTRERVSTDATFHTFLWNRVWTNYCLRANLFKRSPQIHTYPAAVPRAVPTRAQ